MHARAMETYWLQVALLQVWGSLTNENQRMSDLSMAFTKVICFLFNKSFLTSNCYYIDHISCVRWSPSGDMIATASWDKTVALLDFKTGKKLYTEKTSDRSKFHSLIHKYYPHSFLEFVMSVCFIWERIKANHPQRRKLPQKKELGE